MVEIISKAGPQTKLMMIVDKPGPEVEFIIDDHMSLRDVTLYASLMGTSASLNMFGDEDEEDGIS